MRKFLLQIASVALCVCFLFSCTSQSKEENIIYGSTEDVEEGEGYDGPAQRDSLEFLKMRDPALGYVPTDRIINALDYTEELKSNLIGTNRSLATLLWEERGPIYDSLGPSNGNTRGGGGYTSGRIRGVLVDTLNDPTGNTVFCGGVAGGLWKCTNFLSTVPNWIPVNDYFDNLAVSAICQDPSAPATMYFSTGEATSNADAVYGGGVWKSTNAGNTWTRLASTTTFIRNYKILCDAAGNVYLAARVTTTPVAQPSGLLRSKDKGVTWTNITPTGLTSNSNCTDIEISSTGKLHASFGYLGTIVNHRFTSDPANVTQAGWTAGTGIRQGSSVAAVRMELAALADTLYAVTVNTAYNVDSCYKSIDGGATWTKQNAAVFPGGLGSGQGWYNLTLAINPDNSSQFLVGGLDAYRSLNSGSTVTRLTFWVTSIPYVHADHHFMQWWNKDGESRVLIGCDGGLFLSRDGGTTWKDKNRNLGIKQFYAAAIHPAAGSNYLLAGAQDNGVHAISNAGLTYSSEVTGGDGCFVHINQQNAQVQFGSYVYNQYRRSVNGGASWSSVNFSASAGMFVNPFDYDDAKNVMYASWASNVIFRWPNANTANTANTLTLAGLGTPSSFKVSPNTPDRVFVGSSSGRLYKLDKADTVTAANLTGNLTNITGAGFPAGFMNCINVGSTDNSIVAIFTNYGVNNVWHSSDGGTTWAAIDGNLPDMPVRWAVFVPGNDNQLVLATEAGIYSTESISGAATDWKPNPGFPTVRTDMLKIRTSDNTIVAATHGRGLFTAAFPNASNPEIRFVSSSTNTVEETVSTIGCRNYKDYVASIGIINPPSGDATVTYTVQAGGTAVRGVDFEFTTNGDFNNVASTHVFASGVTAVKTINIRIYDDVEIESAEQFTISFSVSGSTNAVAGSSNAHQFIINDNDEGPGVSQNLNATIGIGNTNLTQPFRSEYSDSRTQMVYLASELKAAGFKAGTISALSLNVTAKNSTAPFNGFTIKMKNTATSNLTGGAFEAGTTVVYGPLNYSTVAGVNSFTLSTPFNWDGVSNIMVDFCFDNDAATLTDNVAGTGGISRCHFERVNGVVGCAITNAGFQFAGGARPDITFSITTAQTTIASAVNTTKTEYLTSNNDLYYFSSAGELLARVKNLSAHNYGCTEVVIDRAGTGSSQFWNTTPANYLMNKTFRVLPTTNNTAGRYEVTLYFTKAEKEGWEAATGQSWNNIQLVKLPGRISAVTPLSAQPDGPATVQVVTPVRGTFGTGFTLTYTFDNGFGGFGAGIPGRMNTILNLTGTLQASSIGLNWTTSAEINSTNFEIEKSYNGVDFRRIGTVAGAGNKFTPSSYNFSDSEMVQINYYRIRMLHSDGYVLLSNTIMIRNDNVPQRLYVLTNPFDDEIRMRFARVPSGRITFSVFDMGGKLIKKYSTNAGSNNLVTYNIRSAGVVSKGIYILDVLIEGKHYTAKVMKR